jgi:CRP-like cAMP-binding protein
MFTTAFADMDVAGSVLTPWEARANEIGAKRLATSRALKLLQGVWAKDRHMQKFDVTAIQKMERFFEFATIAPDRDIIRQDEYGNFMVVLLHGSIAVDRIQPWGENMRLTEVKPGDILGEMSLLDSGLRFSQCTSLSECEIAVLGADALDEMLSAEPLMAANLIALLARKLSLRLRAVSARLTEPRP